MKDVSAIVTPPFYKGTSFEDIVNSLIVVSKKHKFNIEFIGNTKPISNSLIGDKYLDDFAYIAGQLRILNQLIKRQGSLRRILFIDFFNPGLDLFKYSLSQLDADLKISSLLHGGSFFPGDLYSENWMKKFEEGWFEINDTVYVPSNYAKKMCPNEYQSKVKVFTWGMDSFRSDFQIGKEWDVVYPHRLQHDKGVDEFIELVKKLPKVNFLITTPLNGNDVNKSDIYKKFVTFKNIKIQERVNNNNIGKYISRAKIVLSCSLQETFGYSVMKSVSCGCYPLVPNRASYPEFFKTEHMYNSTEEACDKVNKILSGYSVSTNVQMKKDVADFTFKPLLENFMK